jgi:hypothetical protein
VIDAGSSPSSRRRWSGRDPAKDLDALNRRDFVYDVRLLMIPGGQRLSLAVRDEPTNTVSYVQQAIFVSALPQETPR